MHVPSSLLPALALLLALPAAAAAHAETPAPGAHGPREIPDAELERMRGRYTVGNDAVAWFGVAMVSTWQTQAGLNLKSTMALGMNFTGHPERPQVSFQPTVSIVRDQPPAPAPSPAAPPVSRSIDGSGLANVSGLVQSVQVAGDGNLAHNQASLSVSNGDAPPPGAAGGTGNLATVSNGDATASAGFDGQTARVLLTVAGQGAVQQWIQNGSLGQSVQISADGQVVSNQLQVQLVRQALPGRAPLAESVAQAISLTHGLGRY